MTTPYTLGGGARALIFDGATGEIALHLGPARLRGRCGAAATAAGATHTLIGSRVAGVEQRRSADGFTPAQQFDVCFEPGAGGLALRLALQVPDGAPFIALRVGVVNHGPADARLHTLTAFETAALAFGSGPLDGWVNGFHSWSFSGYVPHDRRQPRALTGPITYPQARNPTTAPPRRAGQYSSEWVAALIDPGRAALVAGFAGVEAMFGQVTLDGRPGSQALRMANTADGVRLAPGETRWGEWAVLYDTRADDPDPLAAYAHAVTHLTPPRSTDRPPPAGWSSWYQFFQDVTAEDMARNQRALADLTETLPLGLIQLDDGYQRAWGDWLTPNAKFPGGVGGWAADVRAGGFTPGLWLSPFTVERSARLWREHPEMLLRGLRGRPVYGGFYVPKRRLYGLDLTHPAAQAFVRETITTIVHEWGIPYLKLDFLYTGALPGLRHDPARTRAEAFRSGLEIVREAAGDDALILGCGCPLGPAVGLVDVMRVGPDVAPFWHPELFGVGRLFRRDQNLPSARNALQLSLRRAWTHRRFWWLDADNVPVRASQALTADEVQTVASVVGLLGSHLIFSDDLPALPDERLRWAASLLPVPTPRADVPGLFDASAPDTVIRRVTSATGEHTIVALVNWADQPAERTIARHALGLPPGVPLLAFDYWGQRAWVERSDPVPLGRIAAHGVRLLALRAHDGGPQLAGTDLHLTAGGEVSEWTADAGRTTFTLSVGRRAAGSVWLWLPAEPAAATCEGAPCAISSTAEDNIYRIPVEVSGTAEIAITLRV